MAQVICTRCGHVNQSSLDRCERCYKKLDDDKTKPSGEAPLSPGTLLSSGKKAPPPVIGTMSSGTGRKKATLAVGSSGGILTSSPSSLSFPGSPSKPLMPLPPHMARKGPPVLEGSIKDLREMQLDKPLSTLDFAGDAFLALFEPQWAVFSAVSKLTRRDKHTAYAIQVEQLSGMIRVALLQGGKVIPPEIGEYVSVWGQEKKGVILVHSLFNHITGVEI